jgi:uncharacterized membrane protein
VPGRADPEREHRSVARRIERDENEFARTLSFFDATFAVAMTLLATTIDAPAGAWSSWGALWDAIGFQGVAFAISFVLVASYWWGNHRFISSLETLSPTLILVNVAMLAFVTLIPFTTDALGYEGSEPTEVASVLYALNVATISGLSFVLHRIAQRDRLFRLQPTPAEARIIAIDQLVAPAVFLASIPVAVLVSGAAARWCWLSLAVLGPVAGGVRARRVRSGLDGRGRPDADATAGADGR